MNKLKLFLIIGFLSSVSTGLILSFKYNVQAQSVTSFSFGAAGDFANGSNFQATVNQTAAHNPAFMIALGDFSYSSGAESNWCGKWNTSFNKIALIVGNHDTGESSGGNITNYLNYCTYRPASLTGTYGHQYYFDYPTTNPIARFILIRPGVGGTGPISYNAGGAGYIFTQNAVDDARSRGIPWVIVGMHKNYISMMEKGNELGGDLIPMLLSKRVDLILQGHEHGYERSKQLTCASVNSYNASCVANAGNTLFKGAGSIIHVIGTGGQGLRGLNNNDSEAGYFAAADNTTYGFGKFTVTTTDLSFTFVRSAGGNFTDTFSITSSAIPPTVDIKANNSNGPITIPYNTAANLSWTSTNATTCTASNGWTGNKATNGSESTGNLTTNKTYTLTCTGTGGTAADSVTVNVSAPDTQAPSVPTNLAASAASSTRINLSWTASTDNVGVVGYKIFRNGSQIGTSTTTTYQDNTVQPSTNYSYYVVATDAAGNLSPPSNQASVTTPAAPCPALPTDKGVAITTVNVTSAGNYKIWSRLMAPDTTNNSYFLQVDSECGVVVADAGLAANNWTWVDYKDGSSASKITVNLSSGNHTIKMIGRETGVKLDRLILTTDLTCLPTNTGDNCVIPDTPPIVSITSPDNGATVSGTVIISASASDNAAVASVKFYIDSVLRSTDTSPPYNYSWNTRFLGDTRHSIYAIATDNAGNSTQSATISVTVNQDPDGDGFTYKVEEYVGTDPLDNCANTTVTNDEADDRWPADFDDNKTFNIGDILRIRPAFNTKLGDANYSQRYDVNADGQVNIDDLNLLNALSPPMFNGERAFLKSCN